MRVEWDFDFNTRMDFDAFGNPIKAMCFDTIIETINDKNAFIDKLERLEPSDWKITLLCDPKN